LAALRGLPEAKGRGIVAWMSERFYTNCPLFIGPVALSGPEVHHLATVRRFRPGDVVCLFNGDGHEYPARIRLVTRGSVELDVLERQSPGRELGFHMELAAPLPKGDRAQVLVEKLTELGVTSFVPLATVRSIVSPRQAKLEKLQRHVIEASKQCGRNVLMQVHPMVKWDAYCGQPGLPTRRLLAHPGGALKPADVGRTNQDVACAVGPEGGFTEEEMQAALAAGWQIVDLGPRILRVETAALTLAVALST
jgi:16S rRNA (uracil1498-N3)-methyltransferase